MSWQEYVDDHLLCDLKSGGKLEHAAIVGQDGGIWAQSASFPDISTEEITKIVAGFTDPNTLAAAGLFIGGTKYLVIVGEPGAVIRGRKGSSGVTIKKTATAMVIGIYGEGVQPADCNTVVENLGEYLIGQGC